ncbi:MAG: hypothetical protein WBW70_05295 [Candidatus Sulfotelmatobacter sp.]|jgi:hypothetical protein
MKLLQNRVAPIYDRRTLRSSPTGHLNVFKEAQLAGIGVDGSVAAAGRLHKVLRANEALRMTKESRAYVFPGHFAWYQMRMGMTI